MQALDLEEKNELEYADKGEAEVVGTKSALGKSFQTSGQVQFHKQHQEYIAEKKSRREEMIRQKKIDFGQSSSDQDDFPSSAGSVQVQKSQSVPLQNAPKKQLIEKIQTVKQQEKYSVSVRAKKNSQWVTENIFFEPHTLKLPNYSYYYKDIQKLKIFSQAALNDHLKIKVSYQSTEQFYLGGSPKVLVKGVPMHYFLFAKILVQKLAAMGVSAKETNIAPIPGIPESIVANSSIYGRILKRSQMLGKWEERFVVVNKEGIYSYKKFNEKHSMFIPNLSIKQIWTRFQMTDNYLIVKVQYNSTKTEFGIPITNYLSRDAKNNWLWEFYKKSVKA